jgi:hypothetical protein
MTELMLTNFFFFVAMHDLFTGVHHSSVLVMSIWNRKLSFLAKLHRGLNLLRSSGTEIL